MSQLAELTIDFVTKGVLQAEKDVDKLGWDLTKADKAARAFADAMQKFQSQNQTSQAFRDSAAAAKDYSSTLDKVAGAINRIADKSKLQIAVDFAVRGRKKSEGQIEKSIKEYRAKLAEMEKKDGAHTAVIGARKAAGFDTGAQEKAQAAHQGQMKDTKGIIGNLETQLGNSQKRTESFAQALNNIPKLVGKMGGSFGGLTAAIGGPIAAVRGLTDQAAGLARAVSFGGGLGIGALVTGAARGTVEGERFALAMEYVVRVVGDKFAPYVRMATDALYDFAAWFKSLDQDSVRTAAKIAIVVTAIAGLVALAPLIMGVVGAVVSFGVGIVGTVGTVIGAVVGIFTGLLSLAGAVVGSMAVIGPVIAGFVGSISLASLPIAFAITGMVALAAAVVALGVYAADAFGLFDTSATKSGAVAQIAGENWASTFMRHIQQVVNFFVEKLNWIFRTWTDAINLITLSSDKAFQIDPKGFNDLANSIRRGVSDPVGEAGKMLEGLTGKSFSIGGKGGPLGGITDYLKTLEGREGDRQNKGEKDGFTRRGSVNFESLQSTWERLNKSLGERDTAAVQAQMGKDVGAIKDFMKPLGDMLKKVTDVLPAVV